jgi:hypothetical protein
MNSNQLKSLIKECVMEVLKEELSKEGFDPQSQGPNMPTENPYPQWNSQMRQLEETDESDEHGRYAQEAGAGQFDSRTFSVNSTFQEVKNAYDPDGKKHDLTLICKKCGRTQSCRCMKPKKKVKAICQECAASG